MKLTPAGLKLIKMWESFEQRWYRCAAGVWTIGYGYTVRTPSDEEPTDADLPGGITVPLSQIEADRLLHMALEPREQCVREAVVVELTDNPFSALVSLCYNIGCGAFQESTLVELVNQEQWPEAAEEFLAWKYVNGEAIDGLLRRRKAERTLFLKEPKKAISEAPARLPPLPVQAVGDPVDLSDPANYPIIET